MFVTIAHVLHGYHAGRGTGQDARCTPLGHLCDFVGDDDQWHGMGVRERVMEGSYV